MLPYLFFVLLSLMFLSIAYGPTIEGHIFVQAIKGTIRNQFFAYQLWFFPCLFVTHVLFQLIKLVKSKIVMLLISFALYLVAF